MGWVREGKNAVFPSRIDKERIGQVSSLQEGGDQRAATIEQLEASARRGKLRFPLLGRAPMLSSRPDAPVAQSEEQRVSNPLVGGSSPPGRAFLARTSYRKPGRRLSA